MSTIVDSHAHLTWDSFQDDQSAVIARALEKGVCQIVNAGVNLVTIEQTVELTESYEQIYTAVGLHPHEARHWDAGSRRRLMEAAGHAKVVAIGECGLDYYYNYSERGDQVKAFQEQIKIARELMKPLIIHTRDAWEDTFATLEEQDARSAGGVFHCFSGSPQEVERAQDLGFFISFSGIVTFKNAIGVQEAAARVRDDRLLVETDCPYLAPHPMRGKRNEPAFVWLVAEKLAEIRGTSMDHTAAITSENARQLFKLPTPQ